MHVPDRYIAENFKPDDFKADELSNTAVTFR